jgi:hypothetical protein
MHIKSYIFRSLHIHRCWPKYHPPQDIRFWNSEHQTSASLHPQNTDTLAVLLNMYPRKTEYRRPLLLADFALRTIPRYLCTPNNTEVDLSTSSSLTIALTQHPQASDRFLNFLLLPDFDDKVMKRDADLTTSIYRKYIFTSFRETQCTKPLSSNISSETHENDAMVRLRPGAELSPSSLVHAGPSLRSWILQCHYLTVQKHLQSPLYGADFPS